MNALERLASSPTAPVESQPNQQLESQPTTGNALEALASSPAPLAAPSDTSGYHPVPGNSGYGASNLTDTSGRPLLTYKNDRIQASQLLKDRVAPTFDPTVAQPVSSDTLHNDRMPESMSSKIKSSMGSTSDQELDHKQPLELGGSNQLENLALEPHVPGSKNTATDPLENELAAQVRSGKITQQQAWQQMAKDKGYTLAEDSPLNPHPGFFGKVMNFITDFGSAADSFLYNVGKYTVNGIEHPIEFSKGVAESALLKPLDFANKILGDETHYGQPGSPYYDEFKKPDDPAKAAARTAGDFLGWMIPYSKIEKVIQTGAMSGAAAINLTPQVARFIPAISQILHDDGEGNRASQARNDLINLLLFKVGEGILGKVFHSPLSPEASRDVSKTITPIAEKLKNSEDIPLEKVEQATQKASQTVLEDTGLTPKEILQEQMFPSKLEELAQKEPTPDVPPTPPELNPQGGFASAEGALSGVQENIQNAQDFIQKSKESTRFTNDLSHDLNVLQTSRQADELRAKDLLDRANISPADAEAIYHWVEDKTQPITEDRKRLYQTYIKPLQEERQRLFEKLRNEGMPVTSDSYTPRFVADKGGPFERLASGVRSVGGSILRKSSGGFKGRTMKALVDEEGNRVVASIKGDHVTAFVDGVATDLGRLTTRTNEQLMNAEVRPFEKKLAALQKEIDVLQSVKTREPVSQAKIDALTEKAQTLAAELNDTANTYIISADKEAVITKQDKAALKQTLHDLNLLSKVKSSEDVVLRRQRLETLQRKMTEAVNKIGEIEAKYNPNELNDRIFTGSDGKRYKIAEATTKEIESNTNVTYHKNWAISWSIAVRISSGLK